MSEIIVVLNVLIILGMVVSAILAAHFEKLLSSVIALGVTGILPPQSFCCSTPRTWPSPRPQWAPPSAPSYS